MIDEIPAHKRLYCSFCGYASTDVNFLVHGPNVNICDECVDACVHLILERDQDAIIRSGYKHLLERIHEMEEQIMRQAITTHSYEPEEAKKMTEIEIALERLADMARDYYLRDPQGTKSAMDDIQIIRDALKQGRAKTMMLVEIAPGIEVFMTANQKADWEMLK